MGFLNIDLVWFAFTSLVRAIPMIIRAFSLILTGITIEIVLQVQFDWIKWLNFSSLFVRKIDFRCAFDKTFWRSWSDLHPFDEETKVKKRRSEFSFESLLVATCISWNRMPVLKRNIIVDFLIAYEWFECFERDDMKAANKWNSFWCYIQTSKDHKWPMIFTDNFCFWSFRLKYELRICEIWIFYATQNN